MRAQRRKRRKPIEAKTWEQVLDLTRDNVTSDEFGLLIGGDFVWLSRQKPGHPRSWSAEIPKRDFDKLVRWYVLGIVPRKPPAGSARGDRGG